MFSKVQDAKLPVGGETLGLKPAYKSHGIFFALAASWVCAGTQLLFHCAPILCHHLMAHETRHMSDGRMWIGLCLARLSPSPNLLVLLQGDWLTWVWPGTLPGFSDSAGKV